MAKEKTPGAAPRTEAEIAADAAREEAELQGMIDAENAEKAAAAKLAAGDMNAKPSTLETLAKIGKAVDASMTEKTEAEIAADLQASMASRLADSAAGKDEVQVNVPKAFFLRLANHQLVAIKAGTKTLPRAHAEHPYSKDNGVTLVQDDASK